MSAFQKDVPRRPFREYLESFASKKVVKFMQNRLKNTRSQTSECRMLGAQWLIRAEAAVTAMFMFVPEPPLFALFVVGFTGESLILACLTLVQEEPRHFIGFGVLQSRAGARSPCACQQSVPPQQPDLPS